MHSATTTLEPLGQKPRKRSRLRSSFVLPQGTSHNEAVLQWTYNRNMEYAAAEYATYSAYRILGHRLALHRTGWHVQLGLIVAQQYMANAGPFDNQGSLRSRVCSHAAGGQEPSPTASTRGRMRTMPEGDSPGIYTTESEPLGGLGGLRV